MLCKKPYKIKDFECDFHDAFIGKLMQWVVMHLIVENMASIASLQNTEWNPT